MDCFSHSTVNIFLCITFVVVNLCIIFIHVKNCTWPWIKHRNIFWCVIWDREWLNILGYVLGMTCWTVTLCGIAKDNINKKYSIFSFWCFFFWLEFHCLYYLHCGVQVSVNDFIATTSPIFPLPCVNAFCFFDSMFAHNSSQITTLKDEFEDLLRRQKITIDVSRYNIKTQLWMSLLLVT